MWISGGTGSDTDPVASPFSARYDLVAFSYPSKLLEEPALEEQAAYTDDNVSPVSGQEMRQFLQRIPAFLKERYEDRLKSLQSGEKSTVEVRTERVRLEKVVL